MKTKRILHACLVVSLLAVQVQAQSFGDLPTNDRAVQLPANTTQSQQTVSPVVGNLSAAQQQIPVAQQQLDSPISSTNWRLGTYGPVDSQMLNSAGGLRPFGAELFDGGFRGTRSDGLNPEYKIVPGDQVTLRVWGAVDIDRVLPVDAQGNIFIPTIGPVQVMGISHAQLDTTVRAAVKKIYADNVSVYTNLQGVQPIALFVTGNVNKPGHYAGIPADSVLYFLDQAAGIDELLGSYRKIKLIRNNQVIARLDLYSFLRLGKLDHPQLENGDTILVEPRGAYVSVLGDVGRSYFFELPEDILNGEELLRMAPLNPGASHALIRGIRANIPYSNYSTLADFAQNQLAKGDEVIFFSDERHSQIVVQLEGSFLGQSHYVLPKNTTLHELLTSIAVDPMQTDYQSVSVRRLSVAEKQRKSLNDSLTRLETTYLGASSSTVEESAIRVREAELISTFVAKARQVKPNGRLVVSYNDELVDIRLQDGDIITLPQRTDAILISGEVYVPQSLVYVEGRTVADYIKAAGGYSQHADEDRILIVRQNGEVRYSGEVELRAGDEILVLPKVATKNLQLASTMTQILYQIAVATKVALDL